MLVGIRHRNMCFSLQTGKTNWACSSLYSFLLFGRGVAVIAGLYCASCSDVIIDFSLNIKLVYFQLTHKNLAILMCRF